MLADFLLGPLRARLLAVLLLHPQQSWHVRELARQLKVFPGTANRELIKLAEMGILTRQSIGNQVRYRANLACPILQDLTNILRKTSAVADVVASALAPMSDRIRCAFIFGSMARGDVQPESDIDVLVIGNAEFGELIETLHPVQDILQRDVNPAVFSDVEFKRKLASGNSWAHDVAAGQKLFLIGTGDDFGELVTNASAD